MDDYIQCPQEITCAAKCDGLNECIASQGYDESEAIGCPNSCVRDLNATDRLQQLSSPNFPDDYGGNLNCIYTIRAETNQLIELKFQNFSMEHHSHCVHDYMMIRDGDKKSEYWVEIKRTNTFCGSLRSKGCCYIRKCLHFLNYFFFRTTFNTCMGRIIF